MTQAASHPGLPFSKQLESLDTSFLQSLLDIKAERERFGMYQQRAEDLKASVPQPVYQKVVDDYSRRLAALDERAKPMKAQILGEHHKLETLLTQLRRAHEEIRLQQQELEFRHAVGEITESGLAEGRLEPDRLIEQYATDLAAAEGLHARFTEACGLDETFLAAPFAASDVDDKLAAVVDSNAQSTEAGNPAPQGRDAEAIDFVPIEPDTATHSGFTMPFVRNKTDGAEAQTFILPLAALIQVGNQGEQLEYRLAALNYIGRAEDNQIHVGDANISRRHAIVEVADSGYRVRDLDSQNGTFVNGDRIKERPLVDGDRIQIGDVGFVFRLPWSARGTDAS